jgi:hypothetical protein
VISFGEGGGRVKEVAAGWAHSMALLEGGTLRVCGCNTFDQLGLGIGAENQHTPVLLPFPPRRTRRGRTKEDRRNEDKKREDKRREEGGRREWKSLERMQWGQLPRGDQERGSVDLGEGSLWSARTWRG